MAAGNAGQTAWTWATMEPEPTDDERKLYDLFVQQYLLDGSTTLAASRCGFQAGFAEEWGKELFRKSYVQRQIVALGQLRKQDTQQDAEYDHSMSISVLRSIATNPMARESARVAAVRQIAAMRGFNAPIKTQNDDGARGGLVFLPGVISLDEWEAEARASQDALAEASRVD